LARTFVWDFTSIVSLLVSPVVQCTLPADAFVYNWRKNIIMLYVVLQVCVRCSLRLFGAHSSACSCASLTESVLHTFLEECDDSIKRDSCACLLTNDTYCSICLGILLPACHQDEGTETPNVASHINNISSMISEVVQRELPI
jgi:hypothetical protein